MFGFYSRKKDSDFAEGLAATALVFSGDEDASNLMALISAPSEEGFIFSVSALNFFLASLAVHASLSISDDRKQHILDNMLSFFTGELKKYEDGFLVRDAIREKDELDYISRKWGDENWEINMQSLVSTFFDKRINDFKKATERCPKNPVAAIGATFYVHIHGTNTPEAALSQGAISAFIDSTFDSVSHACISEGPD